MYIQANFFAQILLYPEKLCIEHIVKTKILHPKNVFWRPQAVKPGYWPVYI